MRRRGLSSKQFWPEIIARASAQTERAMEVPKSRFYRDGLDPYVNRRVKILFDRWSFDAEKTRTARNGAEWIAAQDGLLIFAQDVPLPAHVPFGHMHIRVDPSWRRFTDPDPDSKLMVDGVLYNYINAHGFRNVGLWAVTVTPYTRDYVPKSARPPAGT